MTFPVPKDVRGVRDFEIIQGTDEMLRIPMPINATDLLTQNFKPGEWVKLGTVGDCKKLVNAVDVLATPANSGRLCWTRYVPGDPYTGQGDAVATKSLDIIRGKVKCWTKLYLTTALGGVNTRARSWFRSGTLLSPPAF